MWCLENVLNISGVIPGNPGSKSGVARSEIQGNQIFWVPAFAGMTVGQQRVCFAKFSAEDTTGGYDAQTIGSSHVGYTIDGSIFQPAARGERPGVFQGQGHYLYRRLFGRRIF